MRLRNQKLPKVDYSSVLESYYCDLLLKEKAGAITPAAHRALDIFLQELRELVAEGQGSVKFAKAA